MISITTLNPAGSELLADLRDLSAEELQISGGGYCGNRGGKGRSRSGKGRSGKGRSGKGRSGKGRGGCFCH